MPVMDGFETLRHLKMDPDLSQSYIQKSCMGK